MILTLILFIIAIIIVCTTREPEEFSRLREKYQKFIKLVPNEFPELKKESVLVCLIRPGELGYNINKGYEIAICYDKNVNSMFHVLLHELAHGTVPEYEHSSKFWNNMEKLRTIAVRNNLYTPIHNEKNFCGAKIKD